MAMEYVELGRACVSCYIAIANDDYSGMDESQAQQTRQGLKRIGHSLIPGHELGFSWSTCCVCLRHSGGDRCEVGYLVPLKVSVSRIRLNGGGYDRRGGYWGVGQPLFHVASDYDSVNFELRAADRDEAVAEVLRRHPGAVFYRGAGRPRK